MSDVCKLFPDSIEDPITGRKTESKLFKDLLTVFDRDTAWDVYEWATKDTSLREKYPSVTMDNLNQPTWESLSKLDWIQHTLKEKGLDSNDALKQVNNQYGIKTTSDYNEVAKRLGSLSRNNAVNEKYTGKIVTTRHNGKRVYSLEIVPRTAESEIALLNFIQQSSFRNRMLTIAANTGIATETIDMLCDDLSGQYNSKNPERVFGLLFNLIRVNGRHSIQFRDRALAEELGHAIAAIYEGNELTKDLYKRFATLVYDNRKLLGEYLSLEDLNAIEASSDVSAEAVGKILGAVLYNNNGKIVEGGSTITRGTSRLFKSTGLFLTKLKNALYNTFRNAVNTLSNNKFYKDFESAQSISFVELAALQEIMNEADSMVNSFIDLKLNVEDALKIKQKLNRDVLEKTDLVSKMYTSYENFLKLMEQSGMIEQSVIKDFQLRHLNNRRKWREAKNANSVIIRNPADLNYVQGIITDIADILGDLNSDFNLFTDDFKTMCHEALNLDSNYDMVEASMAINSLPLQLTLLNKGGIVLNFINELNEAFKANRSQYTDEQRNHIEQSLSSLDGMVDLIDMIYKTLSKGAFAAQLATMNNGSMYIERGARIMLVAGNDFGLTGRKQLSAYEGRRIHIAELIDELSVTDGYFDMSWWGLNMQKAGNSVDPVNQLLDQKVKANKFLANKENLRWQKTLLDLRERCKELTGGYNTDFIFEKGLDGKKTGNIRQRTRWGVWESEYKKFRDKIYDKLKEKYEDELRPMTNQERALFLWDKYQKPYYEWHEQNSIALEDAEMDLLPDLFIEYDDYGNPIIDPETGEYKVRDFKGTKLKKRPKPLQEPSEDAEETLEDVEDDLNLSQIKFIPNPTAFGGIYYDLDFDSDLTSELKQFIDEYIQLKAQLDSKINDYRPNGTRLVRLPLFRGTMINRVQTQGAKYIGDAYNEAFFEDSQDLDFGDVSSYNTDDDSFVPGISRSIKEIRSRIPVFGVNKLEDSDQLSTDIFRSTMAYAAMANNIEGLSQTADIALIGLDVLKNRKIEGETELSRVLHGRKQSNIYLRYEKFVEMQIFGLYATMQSIPWFKNKTLSIQKLGRKVSRMTSWMLLAGKLTGGNVNTGTGVWQIMKEAAVGEHFTYGQFWKACEIYAKYGLESNFKLGIAANMRTNKMYRFIAYMDAQNKNNEKFKDMDTKLPLWLKANYAMCWYENGDHFMLSLPYIMKALNTKMYKRNADGTYEEAGNMWDLFDSGKLNTNTDVTDENGNETGYAEPFTYEEDERDENTGETKKVRKHYFLLTLKSKSEYITSGVTDSEVFENRALEIQDEINKINDKLDNMEAQNPNTYLDDPYYKRQLALLRIKESERNKYLLLADKDGYTLADSDYEEFTDEALARFQDSCRDLCDNMHGIYNSMDAVVASLSVFGALALTMKKFYLGYANNAWLTSRDSIAQQRDVEGYMTTANKVLRWYVLTLGSPLKFNPKAFLGTLGIVAPVIGAAVSSFAYHSMALNTAFNLITLATIKACNRNATYNKMLQDGFSQALTMSLKRFFTLMSCHLIFRTLASLFDVGNYKFQHDPEDDDKDDDKETEDDLDEYTEETDENGVVLYRKKRDKSRRHLRRRRGHGRHKKETPIYNYTDYSVDEAILSLFSSKLGLDYSNRAYAMSGGEDSQKTPGILSTLLLTEQDKDGKWQINKGHHDDLFGTYRILGSMDYFLHRWEMEQAVFSPGYMAANLPNFWNEVKTQQSEVLNGIAPVAMSQSLRILAEGCQIFGTSNPTYEHDKRVKQGDFAMAKDLNTNMLLEEYDKPWLDRFIYKIGNYQYATMGDNAAANFWSNMVPYWNLRPFFTDPWKAKNSWDFQRSSK